MTASRMAREQIDRVGIAAKLAAVELGRDALHVVAVDIAARVQHLEQHPRVGRQHQRRAHRGGCEHQPMEPLRVLDRELLRQATAPRHTHHVDAGVAQRIEQPVREPGHSGQAVGKLRRR